MIIGMLDSGLGGLTTLKELIRANISDYYIYFADNLNAPYGIKSKREISENVRDACKVLLKRGAEVIVLACNSATSSVIAELRKDIKLPVFGLEPAIRPALEGATEPVLVLATDYTLKGEKWQELAKVYNGKYQIKSLPHLASLIDTYYPETQKISEYLHSELVNYCNFTRVVLGCTHYVLVENIIKQALPDAQTFEGNTGLAKLLSNFFTSHSKEINIDIEFSGEKQYARYADILSDLVKNS